MIGRRKPRWHVRPVFQKRKSSGEFYQLVAEMKLVDHELFQRTFRMSPTIYENLLSIVGPAIANSSKFGPQLNKLSADEKLTMTLRYLATGDAQQTITCSYRTGVSTFSNLIQPVCEAIWDYVGSDYVKMPDSVQEWRSIGLEFENKWNFPQCLGAIDGKHVVIQCPPNSGSDFYNYKGTFSLVLLAVVDADYKFIMVDIGDKGRFSDAGIFANSNLGHFVKANRGFPPPNLLPQTQDAVPFVFVGDAAFPLRENLMRPFPGRNLDQRRRVFNYRLSRARRVVENAFGILATRWRILRRPIIAKPEKVESIVKATVALHNYLKTINGASYCPAGSVDQEEQDGLVIPGDWRDNNQGSLTPLPPTNNGRYSVQAVQIRDAYADYFLSPGGKLSWQDAYRH